MHSLFANVHKMAYGWPDKYTSKVLKNEVIVNLVDKRAAYIKDLRTHLDKTKLTYKEAVEMIRDLDEDPIPSNLGDFVLAAISKVIGKTITLVKPVIERQKDRNGRNTTVYNCEVEYLFTKDANKKPSSDMLVMVYNGIDYYSPAVPKPIAKLTSGATIGKTFLNDAIKQIEEVFENVPPSESRQSLSKALRFMGAAKDCLIATRLTTGTTVKTDGVKQIPVPEPLTSTQSAKASRKRASASLKIIPPVKEKGDTEEEYTAKKVKYDEALKKEASRYCKMAPNQCFCGKEFTSKDLMEAHKQSQHLASKTWQCPECEKFIGSGPKLWTHVRHHWGRWYFYCDVQYEDKADKDDKGKPKKKICAVVSDERSYMEFHREAFHEVGHTNIRCRHCDYPQISNRHKLAHEDICEEGDTEAGVVTDKCTYCEYGCRGKSTLRNHLSQYHWKELGLDAPPKHECTKCGKTFTTHSGSKTHVCKVKKPKKKPSAAKSKRKLF